MKLESLSIRAPSRFEKRVGYVGEIVFDSPLGKVQINADDTLSRRILAVCADELVQATKHVAAEMTASIIDEVAAPAAIEDGTAAE